MAQGPLQMLLDSYYTKKAKTSAIILVSKQASCTLKWHQQHWHPKRHGYHYPYDMSRPPSGASLGFRLRMDSTRPSGAGDALGFRLAVRFVCNRPPPPAAGPPLGGLPLAAAARAPARGSISCTTTSTSGLRPLNFLHTCLSACITLRSTAGKLHSTRSRQVHAFSPSTPQNLYHLRISSHWPDHKKGMNLSHTAQEI